MFLFPARPSLIGLESFKHREREREGGILQYIDLMASNSEVGGSADYETLMSASDVELLKRAWRNEKAAPEILQYEGALVERAKEQIELVIKKFMFHNLKSEEAERQLSEQEKVFATKCADNLANHFEERVLLKLPENYQSVLKQSLINEVDDMVPQPHLDTFVVCRSKNFVSLNLYEEGESPKTVEMERGDLYFIRYKIVKQAIESGQIDLI